MTKLESASKSKSSRENDRRRSSIAALPDAALAKQAAQLLKHLSDPSRLQLLLMLAEGEQRVGIISSCLSQSQPTVSHHLALLRHAGIVAMRHEARANAYSLTDKGGELLRVMQPLLAVKTPPSERTAVRPIRDPRMTAELVKKVGEVVTDPVRWLRTANSQFDGQAPIDLVGTAREEELHILLEAASQGMFA